MLLTRVDKSGFFVEDDFTMASQGSDYSQLRNGRVIDKTLRIADQFLVDLVHSDFALAPDGTLAEHEAMRIQNYVEQALRNGIVAAGNAMKGSIVDASFSDVPRQRNTRDENDAIKITKFPRSGRKTTIMCATNSPRKIPMRDGKKE